MLRSGHRCGKERFSGRCEISRKRHRHEVGQLARDAAKGLIQRSARTRRRGERKLCTMMQSCERRVVRLALEAGTRNEKRRTRFQNGSPLRPGTRSRQRAMRLEEAGGQTVVEHKGVDSFAAIERVANPLRRRRVRCRTSEEPTVASNDELCGVWAQGSNESSAPDTRAKTNVHPVRFSNPRETSTIGWSAFAMKYVSLRRRLVGKGKQTLESGVGQTESIACAIPASAHLNPKQKDAHPGPSSDPP